MFNDAREIRETKEFLRSKGLGEGKDGDQAKLDLLEQYNVNKNLVYPPPDFEKIADKVDTRGSTRMISSIVKDIKENRKRIMMQQDLEKEFEKEVMAKKVDLYRPQGLDLDKEDPAEPGDFVFRADEYEKVKQQIQEGLEKNNQKADFTIGQLVKQNTGKTTSQKQLGGTTEIMKSGGEESLRSVNQTSQPVEAHPSALEIIEANSKDLKIREAVSIRNQSLTESIGVKQISQIL